jgi:hypothetical protein
MPVGQRKEERNFTVTKTTQKLTPRVNSYLYFVQKYNMFANLLTYTL